MRCHMSTPSFVFPKSYHTRANQDPLTNSASYDILRLYDLTHDETSGTKTGASATPFLIVPGHRTGVISQLYLDPACNFLISTGGTRGWEGASTEVMLGYEIGIPS